jgi:hypothetical protein
MVIMVITVTVWLQYGEGITYGVVGYAYIKRFILL